MADNPAAAAAVPLPSGSLGHAVIPIVNKLQDIFAQLGGVSTIELPQVAVVGSQSSGKSSVLEALVGRDFLPRGNDICTRRPLLLQLVNRPRKGEGGDGEGDEWGEFLHLPNKRFYDFSMIRREIQAETDREAGGNKGVSEKQIRLKIFSPNVLNIALIDLPGITKVPVGDQPTDIEARIRTMILNYIKHETCIILAVSPANADLANSDALQMARMADPDGSRTIGVITKLDIMDRGTDACNFLMGKVIPLRLGYVGVVNRGQQDINNNLSVKEALANEEKFFREKPVYQSLSHCCGVPRLAKKLNQILVQHIKTVLPGLKSRINSQMVAAAKEHAAYGDVPESKSGQGAKILNILANYCEAFSSMVEGKSGEVSTSELSGGARIHYIFQSIFVKTLEDVDPCDDLTDEDIRLSIRNSTGPKSALFVPEVPFEIIVRKQISRLLDPSLQCARFIYDELIKMSHRCLATELQRFPVLRKRMDEVIGNFLREGLEPAKMMLTHIIEMQMDYINTSHPNFIGGNKAVELAQQQVKSARLSTSMARAKEGIENDKLPASDKNSKSRTFLVRSSANGIAADQGTRPVADSDRPATSGGTLWNIPSFFGASENRPLALTLLLTALSLLSLSWDRTGCSPLSPSSPPPPDGCSRFLPMLLPFLSGFLAFHERASSNWPSLRPLGRRPLQLLSLSLTTAILFVPASISFFTSNTTTIPISDLGWPLINTVIFGVILSSSRDKTTAKDFRREFLVTFFCTLLLELIYFPKLSLPGFLFCGLLLWIAVHELGSSPYLEIGSLEPPSESPYSMAMNLMKHILSERKSRKIAVFLLINTAYMVVEFVVGFMSNSLGLISDACHMLFDCAALAIGLYASYISRMPANNQFNYGRGRFEVVSGYVNAVLLVLVGALIVLESFERILDPQEISTNSLLAVSIGGLVVNMVGLVFFHEEHHLAHGGGSACSHSHSHSHHSHHDHQNEHKIPHIDEHSAHCSNSVAHSHGGHNHHVCNHDHKDASMIDADKHCHDHQHEHKCHDHQHDYQDDQHEHQDHQHHDSSTDNHEHHGHVGHDSKGHIHHDKESHRYQESQLKSHVPNHTHSHSLLSKEPHLAEDLRKPKHHHIDHNMEGIFLHVLADTMGSVGVVISTLLIKYKGWMVSDPACSIFISVMIISSVVPLLRNSAEIILQRVPRHYEQDLKVALNDLMKVEGVSSIRNVHIWNLTNTDIVGTLQLHVSAESDKAYLKKRASDLLLDAGMKDVTIQVESVIQ